MSSNDGHIARCTLRGEGFQITFDCRKSANSRDHIDVILEWMLSQELGGLAIKSRPTFIAHRDLQRLATYLENHMAALSTDPDRSAPAFVPQELGFQLQVLAGEVDGNGEGELTVRLMLNIGSAADDGANVYVGGEGVVDTANVRTFVAELNCLALAPAATV